VIEKLDILEGRRNALKVGRLEGACQEDEKVALEERIKAAEKELAEDPGAQAYFNALKFILLYNEMISWLVRSKWMATPSSLH
jgi:hypothetical protein